MFGIKNYAHEPDHREEYSFTQAEASTVHGKKNKQKRIKNIIGMLLVAVIFFALTTVYSQYRLYVMGTLLDAKQKTTPEVPKTPEQVISALKRHIKLPEGTPQIASVNDAKKISSTQPFFKDAVNGDVVVVYDTVIYLYRPLDDIVVSVGDISETKK